MEETFLVNIDCSKILVGNQVAHYTMFVDGSKMSIVYELVEWIRWIFSLEDCFYLIHKNSVIHELEDIQVLSKLKNFQILPCGQSNCVHKKSYRTLLKNFKLIVSWNDIKVHKYFLDKISTMSQKITQKNSLESFPKTNKKINESFTNLNGENDSTEKYNKEKNSVLVSENLTDMPVTEEKIIETSSKPITIEESPSEMDFIIKNKATDTDNFLLQPNKNFSANEKSDVKYFESKKNGSAVPKSSSFLSGSPKKEHNFDEENTVSHMKPKPFRKHTRPFSLGEILSNLRENSEKNIKEPSFSEKYFQLHEESSSSLKSNQGENSSLVQDNSNLEKRRARIRKRKRSKRQHVEEMDFTYALENKKAVCELNIFQTDCPKKPNHIRFDKEDDYPMEFATFEGDGKKKSDSSTEELNNTSASEFAKNESRELASVLPNDSENLPQKPLRCSVRNSLEEFDSASQIMRDDKLMHIQEAHENVSQSLNLLNNSESVALNQDLSHLLSQKDQFKKGIVIQRFY